MTFPITPTHPEPLVGGRARSVRAVLVARFSTLGWAGWASGAVSIAVLCSVAWQLTKLPFALVLDALPASPAFWLCFAASYLATPVADWLIFRRLWRLPGHGFFALLRKNVANNVLFGYIGELYFYAWARRNLHLKHAPFPAIRDVAILSAMAGNFATLAMLAFSYSALTGLYIDVDKTLLVGSVFTVVGGSALVLVYRRRLLALADDEQVYAFAVHLGRIAFSTLMLAAVWALALPNQPVRFWVMLATVRLVTARLPFLPNRDLVLAGAATLFFGSDPRIGAMLTAVALLTLSTHLLAGLMLSMGEFRRAGSS